MSVYNEKSYVQVFIDVGFLLYIDLFFKDVDVELQLFYICGLMNLLPQRKCVVLTNNAANYFSNNFYKKSVYTKFCIAYI